MANGSDVIDEGFFRRYRELLDAEDAAFDELEHAYEDGDRAHWDDDLAAWRKIVEKRCAFLETQGLDARRHASGSSADHPFHERPRRVDDAVGAAHEEVARARDHLDLGRVPVVGRLDHRRGVAELVVLAEHEQLRARVVRDRVEVGCEAQRRRDRQPAGQAVVVGREGHVGAERPSREHERLVAGRAVGQRCRAPPARRGARRALRRARRCSFDAPEVEAQTR